MTKRNEEWSNRETCFMLAYCIFFYIVGSLLLYLKVLFGLGLIIVSTLFFIPSLIDAKKKTKRYLKERRIEKLRRTRGTIIVGGTPQKYHKKKKQHEAVKCPAIDDSMSKGRAMQELELFYKKNSSSQKERFTKETTEQTKASNPNRTYRQLNKLFESLAYHKKIRIAYHANIGSGHHGGSIRKMVEAEAKRRGVNITVSMKGKDIIIEK